MRRSRLVVGLALSLACETRPEITGEQIANDLVGRSVGEGLSVWTFQRDEPRTLTVIEVKRSGDRAIAVVEVRTESRPLPMTSLPAFSPLPAAPIPSLPAFSPPPPPPAIPGMPPLPTMPPIPPVPSLPASSPPPPPTFKLPWTSPRKCSGRLRLQYEWVAGQWSLLRIENLSFKLE